MLHCVFCLLQTNLFASGGNESEIYIWDMNTFGSPMTPGPKTQVDLVNQLHFQPFWWQKSSWEQKLMVLSYSLWRTSAAWRGTNRSNTSWPLPARVAEPQCGTSAKTTSLLKLATTATEYVVRFPVGWNLVFSQSLGTKYSNCLCACLCL